MSLPGQKSRGFFGRILGGRQGEQADEVQKDPVKDLAADASAQSDPASAPSATVEPVEIQAQEPVASDVAAEAAQPDGEAAKPAKAGWFSRLTAGLSKTSSKITDGITGLFTRQKLDAATLDDFEDLLLQADLGVETATRITDRISKGRFEKGIAPEEVRKILAEEVQKVLGPVAQKLVVDPANKPHVILMVGVNGTGKTTTIGKLAAQFASEGKKVMVAAGDTFRAAAIDQLKVWGERTGATVIARSVGADAAGVAFDALKQAKAEQYDVLLIDTAGRLQNKQLLMEELEKVVRVLGKFDSRAPHECVLVLDATTGQNALQQVDVFRERAGVTGLVMTKLDGTARGGILVSIAARHKLPVFAIGIGEGISDLQPFDAGEFASAIAGA
ncbi:MAG: signal recognition particle-docking protein FtsY [Alphaproteobacteria bacterium BRH_c36]|nr:MAG: signal recognition particle-docking protein FtsY [Alphaproteobacteria bacterium BRH_c36]